jgi:hypothetical protein
MDGIQKPEPTLARSNTIIKASTVQVHNDSNGSRWSVFSKPFVKYGEGRHANVELVPQPSDALNDPLVCDFQANMYFHAEIARTGQRGEKMSSSSAFSSPLGLWAR